MRHVVYKHPEYGDADLSYSFEVVCEGPAINAALGGPLWALVKGLWGWATVLFGLLASAVFLELLASGLPRGMSGTASTLSSAAWGTYAIFCGYLLIEGNKLLRLRLKREGYIYLGVFEADSEDQAIEMAIAEGVALDEEEGLAENED